MVRNNVSEVMLSQQKSSTENSMITYDRHVIQPRLSLLEAANGPSIIEGHDVMQMWCGEEACSL
jgi:hypothetical protein